MDPEKSIFAQAQYMKTLLDIAPPALSYDDKIRFALASYNAGPRNVLNALGGYAASDGLINNYKDVSLSGHSYTPSEVQQIQFDPVASNMETALFGYMRTSPKNQMETWDYVRKIYGF